MLRRKIESYLEEWKRISPQSRTAIAKRYLRQLTGFGYIVARGGNRNRSYRMIGV